MESKNNKMDNFGIKGMGIADMLCFSGYLPPRNEKDIERFEMLYNGRKFETETYHIDADAIFDKVVGDVTSKIRRIKPTATIYNYPGALRVAESISSTNDNSVAKSLSQLMKDKED